MSRHDRAWSAVIGRQRNPLFRHNGPHTNGVRYAVATVIGLAALTPVGSAARDLELLTRLLIPGYLAQDFAEVCAFEDRHFLPELPYGPAFVVAFAQHLKIEITSELTDAEAKNVRVAAAEMARGFARKELRELTTRNQPDGSESLRAWCKASAKPFILEIMRAHASKHRAFDEITRQAKR